MHGNSRINSYTVLFRLTRSTIRDKKPQILQQFIISGDLIDMVLTRAHLNRFGLEPVLMDLFPVELAISDPVFLCQEKHSMEMVLAF